MQHKVDSSWEIRRFQVENFQKVGPPGEIYFLVQVIQSFYGKGGARFCLGDLHHLIYGFRGDGGQKFHTWGYHNSLFGKIAGMIVPNEVI